MKRILVVAMLIAASSLVFTQPTRSSANQKGNDEQAVRQLLNELYVALGKNDTVALDRMYADDYFLVNESGVLTTKAPRLAAIKSGELKYESVSFEDVNIHLYGNTAVATYRAMIKAQSKGQDIGGQLRVTVTLVKIRGRWQVVAAQATHIAS
ncbi:MAG TPA: nuclear transport factor 2 family protein [Pyrinomonadaceae bacterium]|nr:nuclear transport factor 2 family protein [Pyrinomonadaceae bacterium]